MFVSIVKLLLFLISHNVTTSIRHPIAAQHLYERHPQNLNIKPDNLYNIKFRLTLNPDKLLAKKITVEDIISKIDYLYSGHLITIAVSDRVLLIYFELGFNWQYINRLIDIKKKNAVVSDIWPVILSFFRKFNHEFTINSFKGINGVYIKHYCNNYP